VLLTTGALALGDADLAVAAAAFLVVVVLTALLGAWPGAVGLVGSAVLFSYAFVPPRGSFDLHEPDAFASLAAFVVAGVACGIVVTRVNTLRQLAERREQEVFEARLAAALQDSRAGFLSAMTHNLRTPLASIKAAASTLGSRGSQLSPAAHDTLVETIHDEAERLERLVTKVLHQSRVQAGAVTPDLEPIDIAELTRSAVRSLHPMAPDQEIRLESDDVIADVDPELLEVVLVSLLENALRFAPPGTAVEVHCSDTEPGCRIAVVDHGPGVDLVDRNRIFDPFVRGQSEGAGLGLAISRSFVEAHQGTLTVESTPGGGATFVVHIPALEVAS
jgi:two-component system, OmpR family, sensor histidine kinase KdpD